MGNCSRIEEASGPGYVLRVRALTGVSVAPGSDHGVGRHLLGRTPTACIRLHDPDVAPHQVAVVLEVTGHLRIRRLGGGAPVRLDGAELGLRDYIVPADTVVVLEVGATRLSLRSVHGAVATTAGEDSPRVIRGPRSPRSPSSVQVRLPTSDPVVAAAPSAMSLVAAGVGLLGGLVMAVVLGTWLFAMFAVLGALTASLTWGLTRWRSRRHLRRSEASLAITRRVMLGEVLGAARVAASSVHAQAPELIDVHLSLIHI